MSTIKIKALLKEPSDDHLMYVLLYLDLGVGADKVAKVINVVDDLGLNKVEVHYDIIGQTTQPDHRPQVLTLVRTQNPYTAFDENHKFYVYAHESGQDDVIDSMDTSDAHRN